MRCGRKWLSPEATQKPLRAGLALARRIPFWDLVATGTRGWSQPCLLHLPRDWTLWPVDWPLPRPPSSHLYSGAPSRACHGGWAVPKKARARPWLCGRERASCGLQPLGNPTCWFRENHERRKLLKKASQLDRPSESLIQQDPGRQFSRAPLASGGQLQLDYLL